MSLPLYDTMTIYAASDSGPLDPSGSLGQLIDFLVASFKPLYTTVIVTCVWSAMLVPLLVILWLFSDKETRRKPMFIANVVSIALGLTLAGVALELMMTVLLHPLEVPSRSFALAFAFMIASSPLFVESVLLIRLWAVYPYRATPRTTFFAIFIPIALLKLARVANVIVYLVELAKSLANANGQNLLLLLQQVWTKFPSYKVEWFLQVADNTSASVLFLAKLNRSRVIRTRIRGWSSALEALFWISLSNFVIPVMLSIAQLVVVWKSPNIFNVVPICIVNVYVQIIGVLLATVWASGTRWQGEHKTTNVSVLTTLQMGVNNSQTGSRDNSSTKQ
ncbi:hypothetical protein APHAL10511_000579 [Amanita phalloides]|nr:hypothetical protein APHAL10511_000579 [Amanita phalloides]